MWKNGSKPPSRVLKNSRIEIFKCVILDDMSTDNSANVIKEIILNDDRFLFIENIDKAFALKNIYDGIIFSKPQKEDVIITLDGDDWLAHNNVLLTLKNVYETHKCWMTYGSYMEYPSNQRGMWAKQIPDHVIENNSFRNYEWCASHIRTFKYHLWQNINLEDLFDTTGEFYKMAGDLAHMFPLLELAGNKSKYISDILYVYNKSNPLNDYKINNPYQVSLEKEIRNGKKYEPIVAS